MRLFGRIQVPILAPFHQLSAVSNFGWADGGLRGFELRAKVVIETERAACPWTVLLKSSQMIWRSTAVPAQVKPACPSSVRNRFSGEVEGEVTSLPFSSGSSIARQPSAAPFITGYTLFR